MSAVGGRHIVTSQSTDPASAEPSEALSPAGTDLVAMAFAVAMTLIFSLAALVVFGAAIREFLGS
jgi:hypothetical protein